MSANFWLRFKRLKNQMEAEICKTVQIYDPQHHPFQGLQTELTWEPNLCVTSVILAQVSCQGSVFLKSRDKSSSGLNSIKALNEK